MARTALTPVSAPGAYASAGVAFVPEACDASNGNKVRLTGKELVIAYNSGVSTRTVTITSVVDDKGRLGSITTENITTLQYRMYGPFLIPGWQQTDGYLYLSASHADVLFSVIILP